MDEKDKKTIKILPSELGQFDLCNIKWALREKSRSSGKNEAVKTPARPEKTETEPEKKPEIDF